MLGKLLKHEFRATGRIMLPMMGAVLVLSLLANISMTVLANAVPGSSAAEKFNALRILLVLIIVLFVVGMIAMSVMTVVLMVSRFYNNLLKDEGYLMFTLPVSTHELIWAKLIVSFVWFLTAGLLIFLVLGFSALNLSGTDLRLLFAEFPSWAELREKLQEIGLLSRLRIVLMQGVLTMSFSTLVYCLHFYAAMSLGHMFVKNRILLSIVFFVAVSISFSIMETCFGMTGILTNQFAFSHDSEEFSRAFMITAWIVTGMKAFEAAVLYFATVLSLKRGLNLA